MGGFVLQLFWVYFGSEMANLGMDELIEQNEIWGIRCVCCDFLFTSIGLEMTVFGMEYNWLE